IYSLCALMLVINEVLSQTVILEAAVGDSVILPCSSRRHEKDVFWRYRDAKVVYDIIEGKENFHDQDGEYRDRVKGFPSEFTKGNYSIRLSDVKLNDAGTYSCQIPDFRPVHVELKINENQIEERQNQTVDTDEMRLSSITSGIINCVLIGPVT
ncbi:antigen like protein, partial [Clarias magur]